MAGGGRQLSTSSVTLYGGLALTASTPQASYSYTRAKQRKVLISKNECLHEEKERAGVMDDSKMRREKGAGAGAERSECLRR
jgi:hypothetical protein